MRQMPKKLRSHCQQWPAATLAAGRFKSAQNSVWALDATAPCTAEWSVSERTGPSLEVVTGEIACHEVGRFEVFVCVFVALLFDSLLRSRLSELASGSHRRQRCTKQRRICGRTNGRYLHLF